MLDRRVRRRDMELDAHELERWLVEQRLAWVTAAGRLLPTARGLELGSGL